LIGKWLSAIALSRLFGDGFTADLAGRGVVYLAGEARRAVDRDDEDITRVRLRAGERYTVVARPPATRAERKLAASQRGLQSRYDKLTRPSRSQVKLARRLAKAQRTLDRTRPNSRRLPARAARAEQLGLRFDRSMRPSKQLLKVASSLTATTDALDASRAATLAEARSRGGLRRRRTRVRVYD
jgi:hypothetical protein